MIKKCPFCKKNLNGGSAHIYKCKKKNLQIPHKELRFEFLKYNYPMLTKEVLENEYWVEKLSLPQIVKKYDIDTKAASALLEYFNIKKRNISEAKFFIGNKRSEETCLKRYGKTNVLSKGTSIYDKRNNTIKQKYGVDNVFQIKSVIDKIQDDNHYLKKYGLTLKQLRSKKSKETWENLTDEQKDFWLKKSILSEKCRDKPKIGTGYWISSIEIRIQEILNIYSIKNRAQFLIRKNGKRKFFDFILEDSKILIEVQGDFWHADPKKYKADDKLHFPRGLIFAKEVWNKDEEKKLIAEEQGYKVIYIWSNEIKNQSIESIKNILLSKLKEVSKIT